MGATDIKNDLQDRQTARILIAQDTNPHANLALENALLLRAIPTLLLWQNKHTVVIGRNQNAWRECDTALLEAEGGTLARRTSGGGAVYHDMGNLNFSFIMPIEKYDLSMQLSCILQAVLDCGIRAAFSGRNDIEVDGRKFSGNAFKFTKTAGLHHGTLLIDSDFNMMSRYLQVSKEKMESKGVKSVPARVINLSECVPGLTLCDVRGALCAAFLRIYGGVQQEIMPEDMPTEESRATFTSWEWNFGKTPAFDVTLSRKLEFGDIVIGLSVSGGIVSDVRVYTDAMDAELADVLAGCLTGCPVGGLSARVGGLSTGEGQAISGWLRDCGY